MRAARTKTFSASTLTVGGVAACGNGTGALLTGAGRLSRMDDVRRQPGEVLAAVHGDHLAGHRSSVNQIEQGGGDFVGTGAMAERHALRLGVEFAFRLVDRAQGGARADAVDAD